ncbi:MAG: hypothetical protein A3K19_30165 [Lentisphaerae bacterium RIFOXYB12_FULL_65_16]|nr:MAG: hypothetical protein A3K18_29530 [Lentisphaerae bacterium RIFOXYA12_64_32]OGV85839.1 MAG: hypothetical protein A3K19_30165 [Lentisphaerae bacterium RIFOXYB12_FULL_65_16]
MNSLVSALERYLQEAAGLDARLQAAPEAAEQLPVHVGTRYAVYRTVLFERPYWLLLANAAEPFSPAAAARDQALAQRAFDAAVALVFPRLAAFERRRLIEKRVAFIVPGQQAFLPMALVDLREHVRPRMLDVAGERPLALTAAAQALFLHLLQHPEIDSWPLHRWAEQLCCSNMTISRGGRELVAAGLLAADGKGRTVHLRLSGTPHTTWKKALPLLRSPVARKTHVLILKPDAVHAQDAGLTALAQLTALATDPRPEMAMSGAAYRAAVAGGALAPQPFADPGCVSMEQWLYAPGLTAGARVVDRLSLFLSLKDSPDERVQGALNELLEGMQW